MPSNAVLILRSPKDPNNSTSDPYSTSFKSHSYDPYFLNVLETTWSEEDTLRNAIVAGPGDRYGGVIITSQNAAEAWNRVVLAEEEERVERGRPRRRNEAGVDMAGSWSQLPFYAVGPSTASSLLSIHEKLKSIHPLSRFLPTVVPDSAKSGNGEKLARFIIQDYPKSWTSSRSTSETELDCAGGKLPLLYLVGDKNTETLRETIQKESRLCVETLQVYSTRPNPNLALELDDVVKQILSIPRTNIWIVFFAPSAAQITIPILSQHFRLPSASLSSSSLPPVRFAAIGSTTASSLREDYPEKYKVDAIPAQPKAEVLVDAIRSAGDVAE